MTLEQTGDLLKVNYSVTNAVTRNLLGGNSITLPAADVFSVQDDIAEGTAKALQLKLRPEEETELKLHGTTTPAAYHFYLQGRGYLVDYTKLDNVDNAVLMETQALKVDPNFGAAKASLGEAYWRKYVLTKDKRMTEQAKSECEAAVALGTAGTSGHTCLGLVCRHRAIQSAATEFQRAVELDPGNSAAIGLASALSVRAPSTMPKLLISA